MHIFTHGYTKLKIKIYFKATIIIVKQKGGVARHDGTHK